jgi:enoyl-CoA hydratase/carnithine racemase
VVTETSRVAMPEITIGLYPDVGGGYFLNKMPGSAGRFLGLTGASINASDCLFLGLADHFIEHRHYRDIIAMLKDQTWSDRRADNAEVIDEVLANFADESEDSAPEHNVEQHMAIIDELFAKPDIHLLIDSFLSVQTDDPWLAKAQKTLAKGSPLSALIIDKYLRATKNMSLAEVFKQDMVLSSNILRFTEFAEGVRALLIDKDNQPNWAFKSHKDIPEEKVDSFFVPPWKSNPLRQLRD